MHKFTEYQGRVLNSVEYNGVPYARMGDIIECIVPGGWSDYEQVLNSDQGLIEDLDLIYLPDDVFCEADGWHIPVSKISCWLFTIKVRDCDDDMQDRFRTFRRDCEKSFRVTWGMDVEDVRVRVREMPFQEQASYEELLWAFRSLGVPVEDEPDELSIYDVLTNLASHSECGRAGQKLADMLTYIDDLPGGEYILEYIENYLLNRLPDSVDLQDFLEELDRRVSFMASQFIGETNAK